jgi:hypothetical protein
MRLSLNEIAAEVYRDAQPKMLLNVVERGEINRPTLPVMSRDDVERRYGLSRIESNAVMVGVACKINEMLQQRSERDGQ